MCALKQLGFFSLQEMEKHARQPNTERAPEVAQADAFLKKKKKTQIKDVSIRIGFEHRRGRGAGEEPGSKFSL